MTSQKRRVCVVGVGDTAHWRVRALRTAGFEVVSVSSRRGSQRLRPFAAQHQIPDVIEDWRTMLEQTDRWDAIAICTWPDGTPEVLSAAMGLGVPILVEKPVAWSSDAIARLCEEAHEHVIVGYNRRFYPAVQEARRLARSGPPLVAQLMLPKDVFAPVEKDARGDYLRLFFESVSALGLDIARFVLGDLQVSSIRRLHNPAGNLYGLAALLSTQRGDILQVTGNLGAAANFSLALNWPGRRFELLPFEVGTEYAGLEVVPPTSEYPVRRYLPKLVRRISLEGHDLVEKPGFVAEALALATLLDGEPRSEFAATLEDAASVTRLCEELTGVRYSQDDRFPNPFAA